MRDRRPRPHAGRVALLGLLLLSGCVSLENAYTELGVFEWDLPPEARNLADKSPHDLIAFAPAGVREFEIGRRLEHGSKGFPSDRRCALIYFEASGRTPTRIRQNMGAAGTQTLTYMGFPNGRVAARRLKRSDPAPVTRAEVSRCESLVNGLR
jgi:hypothetical protein